MLGLSTFSLFLTWNLEAYYSFALNYSIQFVFVEHQPYVQSLVMWGAPKGIQLGLWEFTVELRGKTLTLNSQEIVLIMW